MIHISNINKYYGDNKVLSNVSLNIAKGDIFGIIGLSGAGKSTLIRLLNGLEKVSSGTIVVDNIDITNLNDKQLKPIRKNIGMIFQSFNLLSSKNVYKNIAFPLIINNVPKPEIKQRVQELIKLVGLDGKENSYPKDLSGGQKQRVGIARALANNPKILLCDEATSALDPNTTKSILDLIRNIKNKVGLTVVLITHEMDVVHNLCNKVAVIDKGKIVEQGNAIDIFNHPREKITKEFVIKGYEHEEYDDINPLLNTIKGGKFIKFHFNSNSVKQAVISDLIVKLNVKVNIIEAFISNTNEDFSKGQITAHINESEEKFAEILKFLQNYEIQVEVIDNAIL